MKSNYYCSIEVNKSNKIFLFDLFDEKKELIYNGNSQIRDRINKINKEIFFKYHDTKERILIPINKTKFNIFLDLYYDDIKQLKIINFLTKYKLEEYVI